MNTCKNESCSNESQGSSAYCSNSCRAQQSRRNRTSATPSATNEGATQAQHDQAQQGATHYATRTNPDTLNTGQSMSMDQLKQAKLKANRVPIPGDHDYAGVCHKDEQGRWTV